MSKTPLKRATAKAGTGTLVVTEEEGKSRERQIADIVQHPFVRNGIVACSAGGRLFGDQLKPEINDTVEATGQAARKLASGDVGLLRETLLAHTLTLDALFTEMARRSLENMGQYTDAAQRYMQLALKAQSNCRTTVEALAKIVGGREQVIKHVHVDNRGGQAVIAETVQTGG